jgi:hypothetical protein
MTKKIKHGITVMVQSMKNHEGPLALRDDFQPACDKFKSLQQMITSFITDAENILRVFPALVKQASAFSTTTTQVFSTFPESDRGLADQIANLVQKVQEFTEAQKAASDDAILQPLRDLSTQVNELLAIQTDQKNSFLILESNKAKVEAFQKDPEKNQLKIDQYNEKIRVRTLNVQELEEEFISRMNAVWTNRFEVLHRPLIALMEVVMGLGVVVRGEVEEIAKVLGPEIVAAEYPSVAVQEKPKK